MAAGAPFGVLIIGRCLHVPKGNREDIWRGRGEAQQLKSSSGSEKAAYFHACMYVCVLCVYVCVALDVQIAKKKWKAQRQTENGGTGRKIDKASDAVNGCVHSVAAVSKMGGPEGGRGSR